MGGGATHLPPLVEGCGKTASNHIITSMKPTKALTALLAIPLVLGMTACSKPPEITASSRKEAMDRCMADSKAAMEEAYEERARAKADPKSASRDTNPDFYSDYEYSFLLDDEWETIEITQIYCRPRSFKNHKGYWRSTGYLEYLKRPTDKAFTVETEVEQVVVSYGYTWKEE